MDTDVVVESCCLGRGRRDVSRTVRQLLEQRILTDFIVVDVKNLQISTLSANQTSHHCPLSAEQLSL